MLQPPTTDHTKQRVCLAMIVSNEENTISRCLKAALPFIDCYVIHNLGAFDRTVDKARETLQGIPGVVERHRFEGFADARNRLLEEAAKDADLVLMLDADEEFKCSDHTIRLPNNADYGLLEIRERKKHVRQPRLFRAGRLPRFEYPIKEQLAAHNLKGASIKSCHIIHHRDGARHQNSTTLEAEYYLLKATMRQAPDPRLQLSIAENHLARNELNTALTELEKVAEESLGSQAYWKTQYLLGNLYAAKEEQSLAENAYLECLKADAERAEPMMRLAELAMKQNEYAKAQAYLDKALVLAAPNHADYFEPAIYHYQASLTAAAGALEQADAAKALQYLEPLKKLRWLSNEPRQALLKLRQQAEQLLASQQKPAEVVDTTKSDHAINAEVSEPVLTVGMATYDDYHGVYFTIMSLVLYHSSELSKIEILVVDNNPDSAHGKAVSELCVSAPRARYVAAGEYKGTAVRERVFAEAKGRFVMCMDCHVFLHPGAIGKLLKYFEANPDTDDLFHGPLIYDDSESISTHMEPIWNDGFFGTWGLDERGKNPDAEPFEIPLQGMGLFACAKDKWLGFNPRFRGFGGEEGYIHEKFRQHGGRVLCLPFLRWTHRFARPDGTIYTNRWEDRIRNYLIGWAELGMDRQALCDHFSLILGDDVVANVNASLLSEINGPLKAFTTLYCYAEEDTLWSDLQPSLERYGMAQVVQRLSSLEELTQALRTAEARQLDNVLLIRGDWLQAVVLEEYSELFQQLENDARSSVALSPSFHPHLETPGNKLESYAAVLVRSDDFSTMRQHLEKRRQKPESPAIVNSVPPLQYLVSYWLDPESPQSREDALRTYFDLQIYSKQQFGAEQLIVTNIDYPGAIELQLPTGFKREHGIFVKYFGLDQLMRAGLELPIAMHDHDLFVRAPIEVNEFAIRCCSAYGGVFSEQLVVFPPSVRSALELCLKQMRNFEFAELLQGGYGTETRHEGMYAPEQALSSLDPYPFKNIPLDPSILSRDLVSFVIQDHHSLDDAHCEADPIDDNVQAVHGHLNKGPATDVLVEWLVQ